MNTLLVGMLQLMFDSAKELYPSLNRKEFNELGEEILDEKKGMPLSIIEMAELLEEKLKEKYS